MRLVVTGGAGFIGSNICHSLIEKWQADVIAIDDLSTGDAGNINKIKSKNFEFYKTSILELEKLTELFKEADYIIHQAAIPSVPRSILDPIGTSTVNVNGTLNVLIAARDSGVKRVVLASSSSIYGDTPTLPKREDMVPTPLSPYGVSKLVNELHAKQFYELYGLETVCLRYFNVFGPRQNPKSEYAAVIPKFITKMLSNEQPVIYGDGIQTRDFTYILDVVNANMLALKASKSACGKVFNIAGGKTITINKLVELLNSIMKKNLNPTYEKERAGDIKHSYADIALAKKYLNYNSQYTLEQGLRETIYWFRGMQQ